MRVRENSTRSEAAHRIGNAKQLSHFVLGVTAIIHCTHKKWVVCPSSHNEGGNAYLSSRKGMLYLAAKREWQAEESPLIPTISQSA